MHLSALAILTLTWVLYVEAQWDSGADCVYTLRVTQVLDITKVSYIYKLLFR